MRATVAAVRVSSWRLPLCCALFCVLLLPGARGADELLLLRERVRELIALQKAGQEVQRRWDEQKPDLARERDLLVRQEQEGAKRLDNLQQALARQQETHRDLEAAVAGRRAAVTALAAGIETAERALRGLAPRLPVSLMIPLAGTFAELEEVETSPGGDGVAQRLQRVFSLFSEIENFDNGIHVFREMLPDPEGVEREMDVLYVGLGAAYAVSTGGQVAAAGRPAADHWEWQWDAALADPVRRAVAMYRKEQPAGFLALPVQVGDAGEAP